VHRAIVILFIPLYLVIVLDLLVWQHYNNYLTLGIRNGTLRLQYKAIKSQGINTVDSKCLTPVDVAYYALISCSTLHLIVLPQEINLAGI